MIHDQKRKKILKKATTRPTYLYIKTGKYFFKDEFISKNSIVVDNIGRDDSANIIRKPLKHTKDSFYFYCISTANSIFTPA